MSFSDPELEGRAPGEELKQVRALVHAIAISVLILTGTVFVFLYRQVVLVRRQTSEMARFLSQYEQSSLQQFIAKAHREFADFKRQNPDFTPIYNRYFGTNDPPPLPASTNLTDSKVTAMPARTNN